MLSPSAATNNAKYFKQSAFLTHYRQHLWLLFTNPSLGCVPFRAHRKMTRLVRCPSNLATHCEEAILEATSKTAAAAWISRWPCSCSQTEPEPSISVHEGNTYTHHMFPLCEAVRGEHAILRNQTGWVSFHVLIKYTSPFGEGTNAQPCTTHCWDFTTVLSAWTKNDDRHLRGIYGTYKKWKAAKMCWMCRSWHARFTLSSVYIYSALTGSPINVG